MLNKDKISQHMRYLSGISDWRFAIGVRIRFANPTVTYQTYPKAWSEYYDANHLLYQDPTIRWGMPHTGTATWAELADQDTAGVFEKTATFGLRYGPIVSVGDVAARTLGFSAHANRPLNEVETEAATTAIADIHAFTEGLETTSDDELQEIRALSSLLNG